MPQLYDQFGRPVAAARRPETREVAAVSLADRWSFYPSKGLTPSRLAWIFEAADAGNLREQAELFEEMEEKDAHLASILQTRKLAVLGLNWEVAPASEDQGDEEVARACRELLEDLDLEGACLHLLDAIGKGYAVLEIIWDMQDGWAWVRELRPIPPKKVTFVNSLTPRLLTENSLEGEEFPPWKVVYHRHRARSGHDTRNGVLRVCAYMYLFKNYALKDWATFNEVFGMPLRLGKYDQSASQADRDALVAAIRSLGSDAAGIISKNTEIEFVEAGQRLSGAANPYQVMADFCNREMSKAVLGQTLTTDTAGATGTYAAGQVHQEVRRDLLEADARALAQTIRQQLLWPFVGFNFGWDRNLPRFDYVLEAEEDLKAVAETYEIVTKMAPVGLAHIYERFGIPAPEEGEPVTGALPVGTSNAPEAQAAKLQALKAGELDLDERDAQVIKGHQELEKLVQAALQGSEAAAEALLAPVKKLIAGKAGLEEIRAGLLAAFPELQVDDLAELLYRAQVLAWMMGREGYGNV
ncbi:MAG: DUF935 domain-containing protein [Deltaproteobacteria bacterium]|nr:DUF935 domain-containing protein [Deltaproteobacteria bacterium]